MILHYTLPTTGVKTKTPPVSQQNSASGGCEPPGRSGERGGVNPPVVFYRRVHTPRSPRGQIKSALHSHVAPTTAGKAHQKEHATHQQIREHRQPGAEKTEVGAWIRA